MLRATKPLCMQLAAVKRHAPCNATLSTLPCRFVERGQKVYSEQVVTHTFVPVYPIQDSIPFLLYRTHDNNAVRVTDEGIVRVASVSLPLPADWSRSKSWRSKQEYDVAVSLFFGGTELKLQATDKQTGKSVNTSVAYQ